MKINTHVVIIHDKYEDYIEYFDDEDDALVYARRPRERKVVVAKIIERVDNTRRRVLDSVDQ